MNRISPSSCVFCINSNSRPITSSEKIPLPTTNNLTKYSQFQPKISTFQHIMVDNISKT